MARPTDSVLAAVTPGRPPRWRSAHADAFRRSSCNGTRLGLGGKNGVGATMHTDSGCERNSPAGTKEHPALQAMQAPVVTDLGSVTRGRRMAGRQRLRSFVRGVCPESP
jgi:hypothetical protein